MASTPAMALLLFGGLTPSAAASQSAQGTQSEPTVRIASPAHTLAHAKGVAGFAFHPDNRRLATWAADGTVVVWDLATGAPTAPSLKVGHRKMSRRSTFSDFLPSSRFRYSADGKHLLAISGKSVSVSDASTGDVVLLREDLEAASATQDGSLLALRGREGIVLWEISTHRALGEPIPGELGDFSPDGRSLLVGRANGLHLVTLPGGQATAIPLARDLRSINWWAWSPDNVTLAVFEQMQKPVLWDLRGGAASRRGALSGAGFLPVFDRDGRRLATGLAGKVAVWDIVATDPVAQLVEVPYSHWTQDYVARPSFSPVEPILAVMTRKGAVNESNYSVSVWNVGDESPAMLGTMSRARTIGFTRDGTLLAYKQVGMGVALWSVRARRTVALLGTGHKRVDCWVDDPEYMMGATNQSFSNDGAWFACRAFPKTSELLVWDARVR